MKILKILGIVVGLHATALVIIFANPGCSSTSKPAPTASDTTPKAPDGALTTLTPVGAPPSVTETSPAPPSTSPTIAYVSDAGALSAPRYSPTRPGTAVATALESQPVADVTPAMTYTVAKGDYLGTIAKHHHLTAAELAAANNLKTGAVLQVGQKLVIPAKKLPLASVPAARASGMAAAANTPVTPSAGAPVEPGATKVATAATPSAIKHTVKAGESLSSIAHHYGVRMSDLGFINSISDPKKIRPGQELIIPSKPDATQAGAHAPAVRTTKSNAGGSPAGVSAVPGENRPVTTPVAPAPGQDLDAGLKPSAPSGTPLIKVDDGPPATPPKNP